MAATGSSTAAATAARCAPSAARSEADAVIISISTSRNTRRQAVIASEAKQSIEQQQERVDCFVASLLAMTTSRHTFTFPRRGAPGLCRDLHPLMSEGAGKAGCPMHP